jgi:hypothetical protein
MISYTVPSKDTPERLEEYSGPSTGIVRIDASVPFLLNMLYILCGFPSLSNDNVREPVRQKQGLTLDQ